jgi:hypothetical protein
MALGEDLLLYSSEDAEELARYARAHGCSVVKKTRSSIQTEMNLRGKIHTFLAFLESRKKETGTSDAPGVLEQYHQAYEEIEHRLTLLKEYFSRNALGTRIDQGSEWNRLKLLTETDSPRHIELSAEDEEFLRDRYLVLVLLQDNELVETKEGGMYLQATLNPAEAFTQYPADLLFEPENEELARYDIKRVIVTYSETTYQVTLGPEAVLMIDLENLEEFCRTLEVDEESLARMLMNLALKKMIMDKITFFLREKKKVTKEEILSEMRDFNLDVPDTVDHFTFHLHTSFIEEILDDLRKMRTIQGKDTKIRYTGE